MWNDEVCGDLLKLTDHCFVWFIYNRTFTINERFSGRSSEFKVEGLTLYLTIWIRNLKIRVIGLCRKNPISDNVVELPYKISIMCNGSLCKLCHGVTGKELTSVLPFPNLIIPSCLQTFRDQSVLTILLHINTGEIVAFHPNEIDKLWQGIANINIQKETISKSKSISSLEQDFKRLLQTGEHSDVILNVKKNPFKAHKNILSIRCPVFHSMFKHKMVEGETGVIDIEDCDPESFQDFLHFIYTGKVEDLTTEKVFSLYKTADKYCMDELKEDCVVNIKSNLTVETFCDALHLSLLHSEEELLQMTTKFLRKKFQEICVTVKWMTFLQEYPMEANEAMKKAFAHES